jgi:hypothetical protein
MNSEDTLLEALRNYVLPAPIEYEYRVYFSPQTKECIYKTISDDAGEFVIVTREEYEGIHFCPHYTVKNGKLEKKKVDFMTCKLLQLSNKGFKSLPGANMFLVNDDYSKPTEHWDLVSR